MTRAERLGLGPGNVATYINEELKLTVVILDEVEGWFEVQFSDGSTAIVRPSSLITKGQAL